MHSDSLNEYDKLIERFRESLQKPLAERDFMEDELIAIFDRAADTLDDYVRVEVLLLGARLYPYSKPLLERRAVMYNAFGKEAINKFFEDNDMSGSAILFIISISNNIESCEVFFRMISILISEYRLKEDEEIIQFVQLFNRADRYEWLFQNLATIEAICDNKSLLYFEAAVAAECNNAAAISVGVLEKLTELEPYSAEYWTMLSAAYSDASRFDEAANAIDYALAIKPDFLEAITLKVRLADHLTSEIESLIKLYCTKSAELMTYGIRCGIAGTDNKKNLEDLYKNGFTLADDWNHMAAMAFEYSSAKRLLAICQTYEKLAGDKLECARLYPHALFKEKRYDAIAQGNCIISELSGEDELYTTGAIILLATLRVGATDMALQMVREMYRTCKMFNDATGSQVLRFGFRSFLSDVEKRLQSSTPTDWETYAPLGLDDLKDSQLQGGIYVNF